MRIAFLSVSAEMGGSEASLLELVRGLAGLSDPPSMTVVVPREGALAVRVRVAGADVRVLPMPPVLAGFGEWAFGGRMALARRGVALLQAAGPIRAYRRCLRALLAELQPDVVHSNGFKLHLLASRALPENAALVWHIHEYVSTRALTRRLLKRSRRHVTAIVANSRSVADDIRAALGGQVPVTVIYNAVDLSRFAPSGPAADLDALAHATAPSDAVRVGLVATFARWKGHATFLRALASVPAGVQGYIVGGALYDTAGSQYSIDELRTLAADLGVADRVRFTGFVEDAATAMRALDVVVHASSTPEPFGLVIAEAMACGRATIVSAAGGAAELVEDGVTALAFVPEDAAQLARAIGTCAVDAPLRRQLGAAARASAERLFDPAVFANRFMQIYERIARVPAATV